MLPHVVGWKDERSRTGGLGMVACDVDVARAQSLHSHHPTNQGECQAWASGGARALVCGPVTMGDD